MPKRSKLVCLFNPVKVTDKNAYYAKEFNTVVKSFMILTPSGYN
jgi:hypothetical protein